MKLHRPAIQSAYPAFAVAASLLIFTLASCDKMSGLVDEAKGLVSDDEDTTDTGNASVDKVNEQQAKTLLAEESRLVMVEFYTDT